MVAVRTRQVLNDSLLPLLPLPIAIVSSALIHRNVAVI